MVKIHTQTLVTLLLSVVLTLSASPCTHAKVDDGPELPPTQQTISCVGFSADGKEAAFHVIDENIGTLFQVRSLKRNEIVASYPFDEGGEKSAWRRVKRKHKLDDAFNDSPENTRKNVVMMSQVKKDAIHIFMMRGEAIKPYTTIPLYTDKKGRAGEAFVKQMIWNPKGKLGVVIYHQKTAGPMVWKGDFVHTFKFKSYRLDFTDETEK